MLKGRKKELADKADAETARCEKWLHLLIRNGQPKLATKAELCAAAIQELHISKNSFDRAWFNVIEDTGRHDWYEPLRKRKSSRN